MEKKPLNLVGPAKLQVVFTQSGIHVTSFLFKNVFIFLEFIYKKVGEQEMAEMVNLYNKINTFMDLTVDRDEY